MISAIIAITNDGVIGKDGDLPWPRITEDMKWFAEKTTNNIVVMGRKTWDSLPDKNRPLKNRTNVVVTSQKLSAVKGAAGTLNGVLPAGLEAHQHAHPDKEVFVIGGKEIYEQCFSGCERIYVTRVYGDYEGDTTLDIDKALEGFQLVETISDNEKCTFETWERK